MQRNMNLVRMILSRIESSPSGWGPRELGIKSYSPQEVVYHIHIMQQEGLIETVDGTDVPSSEPETFPIGITWKGHEFLDLARDQGRWNKAKAIVDKIGGAPIAVWSKVLTDLMLQGVEEAVSRTA